MKRRTIFRIYRENYSDLYSIIKVINNKYLFLTLNENNHYTDRIEVVKRINKKYFKYIMSNDRDYFVIKQIIEMIDKKEYLNLLKHKNISVRRNIAFQFCKADHECLPLLINDESHEVRVPVASNIDKQYLPQMMNDTNPYVIVEVAKRIDPQYLHEIRENNRYASGIIKKFSFFIEEIISRRLETNE